MKKTVLSFLLAMVILMSAVACTPDEPSPDTTVISQKLTEVANNADFTVLHVNGAFPTAFSTEFPAAVSALVLGQVDAQGFVDQLQTAIDNAA